MACAVVLIWQIFRTQAKVCVCWAKQEVHSSGKTAHDTNIPHHHNTNHVYWKNEIQSVHNTMTGLPTLQWPLYPGRPWQMCLKCLLCLLVIYERSNDRPIDVGVHQHWQLLLQATSESGHSIWPYDSWTQAPRQMITLSDARSVTCCIRAQYADHDWLPN